MYGPIAETIRTQRLVLEPPAPHDADDMAPVLDDRRLHRHIGGAPLTRGELREQYERLAAGASPFHQEYRLYWIVRRARDGQAVGYVQATVRPAPDRYAVAPPAAGSTVAPAPPATVASVAWVIGMPYQGFGFATEAAGALLGWLAAQGVREIVALIHPGNRPSAAVADRIGLRPTAETADDETVWRLPPAAAP